MATSEVCDYLLHHPVRNVGGASYGRHCPSPQISDVKRTALPAVTGRSPALRLRLIIHRHLMRAQLE